jgi:GT2 family glycosyltransferase
MYFEELYIQDEVKKKGFKIMADPTIIIKHEGHGSSGGDNKKSPFNVFYIARNRIIWMKEKNPKRYPLFIFNYFLFVLPAFVCLYAIKRRWKLISYLFKGSLSAIAWIRRKEKILFSV